MKKRLIFVSALLAAVVLLFSAVSCEDKITETRPTAIKRYLSYPAWVEQGNDAIKANAKADIAASVRSVNNSDGYLPVIFSDCDNNYNYYIIYLGYVDNVPIDVSNYTANYNGTTPVTINRQISKLTEETVTESIVKCVEQTVFKSSVSTRFAEITGGLTYKIFSVSAKANAQKVITNSVTNKTSVTETWETVNKKAETSSDIMSFTVGNNSEPPGRYRFVIFATTDIYLSVKLSKDNKDVIESELSVCARPNSLTFNIDYDPNFSGEFLKHETSGLLPVPDDFTSLLVPLPFTWERNTTDVLSVQGFEDQIATPFNVKLLKEQGYSKFTVEVTFDMWLTTSWDRSSGYIDSLARSNSYYLSVIKGHDEIPMTYLSDKHKFDYTTYRILEDRREWGGFLNMERVTRTYYAQHFNHSNKHTLFDIDIDSFDNNFTILWEGNDDLLRIGKRTLRITAKP